MRGQSLHAELADPMRELEPRWNKALIIASVAISFLGAFTSTQLMCYARTSLHFSSVLTWSLAGSVIFGFCSIWSLHEVAMLAYELDLPIGVNPTLTVLSSVLAVAFSFAALSKDLLWRRWKQRHRKRRWPRGAQSRSRSKEHGQRRHRSDQSDVPLLETNDDDVELTEEPANARPATVSISKHAVRDDGAAFPSRPESSPYQAPLEGLFSATHEVSTGLSGAASRVSDGSLRADESVKPLFLEADGKPRYGSRSSTIDGLTHMVVGGMDQENRATPSWATSEVSSPQYESSATSISSGGITSALGVPIFKTSEPARNALLDILTVLWAGLTLSTICTGLLWSVAITGMHYVGMLSLRIPASGYLGFNWPLVLLSAMIGWAVCTVGCVLMSRIETRFWLQILFSAIATSGVAALHFTGMAATSFYSRAPPNLDQAGYPPALANSVVGIAFITCIAANMLLSHSSAVSRNKLAEIVWTRKELWRTIALKETAEAAAKARSDFIASASHEIRTPLHHLQGYGDLLGQTDLSPEGRDLLTAMHRATKTLSLITNNVLDWSKFEREEGTYRPSALDLRAVCESVVVLLPNADEDSHVDSYVVVSPSVPRMVFLDETFIHRILINLLSNALKFTRSGYIMLVIQKQNDNLVAVVQDTGYGLDPSFIPEMWTPFKQGEVRGSARGTGLGLSIVRQLLKRMNGTITVESKYMHSEGVGPGSSGTKFTVTIPLSSTMSQSATPVTATPKSIAILSHSNDRSLEGLAACWAAYGFQSQILSGTQNLNQRSYNFLWTDLHFLNANPSEFDALLRLGNTKILIPYDTHDSLAGLPGILSVPHIIMLPKPLIWHTIPKRLAAKRQQFLGSAPTQALRFATEVEILDTAAPQSAPTFSATNAAEPQQTKEKHTILLVEDNLINQRLGIRMLASLGYEVITAADGLAAIHLLLVPENDVRVSAILMDQSMPVKDGVTATREIRELERRGALKGRGALGKQTPIVAVTAVVNREAQASFSEAGADAFLAKPLSLERLKELLLSVLA